MSKQEIQSWIAEAAVGDDSDSDSDLDIGTSKPSNAPADWTSFLDLSRRTLLDARLGRLDYLSEKLLAVAERGGKSVQIFTLLPYNEG